MAGDRELVLELALALRERVLPSLGSVAGRSVVGEAAGGDVTFAVDEMAEAFLEEFVAARAPRPVLLSSCVDLGRMFWGFGFRGRPARRVTELLGDLIDASSVGGGTFELGSQAFAMTRIVTGQFDAVIEVGSRMVDSVPGMREEFERVGRGQVLNNSPYDLAAPWLVLREAGGVASDGWGAPLDGYRLLGSGHEFQISSICAANAELHARLVREVDAGMARLSEVM